MLFSTTSQSNLRLLLEESGDDITSEYLCSTTNIAAATRNDVWAVTNPFESTLPENEKQPSFNSQDTIKYPGDDLHSSHVDFIESSSKDSYHICLLQSVSTITSDLSSVACTRFTSSDDENVKSCCTDCARAFRKEDRDNLKWRLLACFATICNPSSYSLRGRPSSLGIDARLIPNSLL